MVLLSSNDKYTVRVQYHRSLTRTDAVLIRWRIEYDTLCFSKQGSAFEFYTVWKAYPYRKELHWNSIKFPLFFWALKHHWFSSSQIWDITSTIKCLPKKTSYFPVSSKNSLKVHWNPIETPLKMNTYANEFDQ